MLIKASNPMIKIFTGSSSKNKSLKPFDFGEVGLGIVAALENSGGSPANRALFSRNLSRIKQVPIDSSKISKEIEMKNNNRSFYAEKCTAVVTCRDPKESYTMVYFNNDDDNCSGDEHGRTRNVVEQSDFRPRASVFHISPANNVDTAGEFPTWDFLSSCSMCQKKLHGQDIYMYRGEKAFCSAECRYSQIVTDERKEKYYSKEASAAGAADVSSSSTPYVNGQKQVYATEILAT